MSEGSEMLLEGPVLGQGQEGQPPSLGDEEALEEREVAGVDSRRTRSGGLIRGRVGPACGQNMTLEPGTPGSCPHFCHL